MNATAPVSRFRITPSGVGAFALALALHGLWWFTLARTWHPNLRPESHPTSPALTYLPASSAMSEARHLGSPVLFALPSELGFSGRSGQGLDRAPDALRIAAGEPVLLAQAPSANPAPVFLRSLEQVVASAPSRALPPPEAARAFAVPAGTTGFVLRVYWPDGTPAVRGGLPGAGVLAAVLQDRPWELGAVLEFDAQGGVRHVFIEKPTSSRERNEAVSRALRAVRIDSGGRESRSRVVVQYDQDAGPRAPAGGAGRP